MTTARGARIVGTLRRTENGRGAVRMEDRYGTGIEDLWSALTEPDRWDVQARFWRAVAERCANCPAATATTLPAYRPTRA